jgi:hypothetical protein
MSTCAWRSFFKDDRKMRSRKQLIAGLGAIAFALGGVGSGATLAGKTASDMCSVVGELRTQEECACEAALKENTIEALEGFLHNYGNISGTACTALARVSLDRFRPDNDPDIGSPTDGSPYTR